MTRDEVSKVLNVTVQTLNNWRREGVLSPLKISLCKDSIVFKGFRK